MNMAAKAFANYLDKKDVRYTLLGNSEEVVLVNCSGDSMPNIGVVFFFSTDTSNVAVHVFDVAKIPEEKVGNVCFTCTKLNEKYRWVKLYVNTDGNVVAEIDAIITPSTVGEVCYELLQRMQSIVDESYPVIMKTIWS